MAHSFPPRFRLFVQRQAVAFSNTHFALRKQGTWWRQPASLLAGRFGFISTLHTITENHKRVWEKDDIIPMLLPKTTKTIVVVGARDNSPLPYEARVQEQEIRALRGNEILVRIAAAAFNHRDLWIRKNLYPGIGEGEVFGSDGAGSVIASGTVDDPLVGRRVFLTPSRGWEQDPVGPERKLTVIGGVKGPGIGTFAEYVVVERDEVIEIPSHLDFEHAAAWPLAGVTAWRAINFQARVKKGHNVLLTGIGGGVAIIALQLLVALGANVYITSGSEEKIKRAIQLGAKAGFNYKSESWSKDLEKVLKQENQALDSVIDSAGGDIIRQTSKLLKPGGAMVFYGMTSSPQVVFTMREVLANIHLKGSAMGSKRELIEATNFIAEHKIIPVVCRVIEGLESFEDGFEMMSKGAQFGKIVIRVRRNPKL